MTISKNKNSNFQHFCITRKKIWKQNKNRKKPIQIDQFDRTYRSKIKYYSLFFQREFIQTFRQKQKRNNLKFKWNTDLNDERRRKKCLNKRQLTKTTHISHTFSSYHVPNPNWPNGLPTLTWWIFWCYFSFSSCCWWRKKFTFSFFCFFHRKKRL